MKGGTEALDRFRSVEELIAFLRSADPDASEGKNPILHALIRTAQSPEEAGRDARTLLLVAMWPALEHSFFRLLPMLSNTGDPFAEVYWAFLEEVQHWNLGKRSRIAANLQRNTEKRVRRSIREDQKHEAACRHLQELGPFRGAVTDGIGTLSDTDKEDAAVEKSTRPQLDTEAHIAPHRAVGSVRGGPSPVKPGPWGGDPICRGPIVGVPHLRMRRPVDSSHVLLQRPPGNGSQP